MSSSSPSPSSPSRSPKSLRAPPPFDENTDSSRDSGLSTASSRSSDGGSALHRERRPRRPVDFSQLADSPSTSRSSQHCETPPSRHHQRRTLLRQKSDRAGVSGPHPKPMRAMSDRIDEGQLPSILEVKYSLPGVDCPRKESQAYRSISPLTLLAEFERLGEPTFHTTYLVVDCRFPYEFAAGHIRGAVNVYKKEQIKATFFPDGDVVAERRIPIFHCEFSQKRGPAIANAVRSIDRVRNGARYPHVDHPVMYLLDLGYKQLWSLPECRRMCEPCNYLPMNHNDYIPHLKASLQECEHSKDAVDASGELKTDDTTASTMAVGKKKRSLRAFRSTTSLLRTSSTLNTSQPLLQFPRKSHSASDVLLASPTSCFTRPTPIREAVSPPQQQSNNENASPSRPPHFS